MIIQATAGTVRNALSAARRTAGLDLRETRERFRSGGEDGLYRVHLDGGHIVEVTVVQGTRAEATIVTEAQRMRRHQEEDK